MDEYLKNLIKALGIGAAFASLPLFAAFAKLEPPWPPAIGYVSAAIVFAASLMAWEWTRKARQSSRRRWIVSAAVLTIVGLTSYLILYSLFVEPIPGSEGRVIRGYECTRQAILVYPEECPELPRDALRDAEWEAPVLWTKSSLTAVRLGLILSWLVFTAGLIAAVGSIVAGRKFGGRKTKA